MIVPQYWAEARRQHRDAKRQITVRRFGWSDESIADAQLMADHRVDEALREAVMGRDVPRREPKVAYNGATGVPIREEVVARHGDCVITRNSYGARCLNTPDVLFADVDFTSKASLRLIFGFLVVLLFGSVMTGWFYNSRLIGIPLSLFAAGIAVPLANLFVRVRTAVAGGPDRLTCRQITRFLERNPEWNVRRYRTPAGLRLLVTHECFEPDAPVVREFFRIVGTDPTYMQMCLKQKCFRARLSAKPWRIGIGFPMRPRTGVWPVRHDRLPERTEWIANYEAHAEAFAACTFIESMGSGYVHPKIATVMTLHDNECRALIPGLKTA